MSTPLRVNFSRPQAPSSVSALRAAHHAAVLAGAAGGPACGLLLFQLSEDLKIFGGKTEKGGQQIKKLSPIDFKNPPEIQNSSELQNSFPNPQPEDSAASAARFLATRH